MQYLVEQYSNMIIGQFDYKPFDTNSTNRKKVIYLCKIGYFFECFTAIGKRVIVVINTHA